MSSQCESNQHLPFLRRIKLWTANRRPIPWARICRDASQLLRLPPSEVDSLLKSFLNQSEAANYGAMLDAKTLSDEEAFLTFLLFQVHRPSSIVEIGTQHGRSTRRIIDMCRWLGLQARIYCFDITNSVRFFAPHEAQLIVKDVTHSFELDVIQKLAPDFVFVDARPYYLLRNVLGHCFASPRPIPVTVHDCGPHLCVRSMNLPKDDFPVSSSTGVWERHVLAELFGVHDPLSSELDRTESANYSLRIFPTRHGLAVINPRAKTAPRPTTQRSP